MIEARGLRKTFKSKPEPIVAVEGIDLDVAAGELVAILGPNGAGKSTTLRMLTTLLAPTDGVARVAGHDVVTEPAAVRRRIGYIGQGNGAGHYHHVRDEVVLQGRAYGLTWRDAGRRADELLDTLQLSGLGGRTAGTLSGGQRRRLDIAMGLVHAPPLLFLDEPSTGLDPQNRAVLWEHVLDVRERFGTTLLLTTHYLGEAERMAERVMIVDHGRIIADDSPQRLTSSLAADTVTLGLPDLGHVAAARTVVDHLSGLQEVTVDGTRVTLRVAGGSERLPAILRDLGAADVAVARVEVARPTLDDVFLNLTGRSLREEAAAAEAAADEATEVPA